MMTSIRVLAIRGHADQLALTDELSCNTVEVVRGANHAIAKHETASCH